MAVEESGSTKTRSTSETITLSRSTKKYKKIPNRILVLSKDIKYFPTVFSAIDYTPCDEKYDLVIVVGYKLRINVPYPFSIADSEIWFERGTALTRRMFERAMWHYSECQINNGV